MQSNITGIFVEMLSKAQDSNQQSQQPDFFTRYQSDHQKSH